MWNFIIPTFHTKLLRGIKSWGMSSLGFVACQSEMRTPHKILIPGKIPLGKYRYRQEDIRMKLRILPTGTIW
jgi:hypothetical protein